MYSIELTSTARKDILHLPTFVQRRIESVIDDLVVHPRPRGYAKLKGLENMWRIRVGDYRILYGLDDRRMTLSIYRILHRKEVYR